MNSSEKKFYNRLNYSIGNEDWEAESKALRLEEGDRCLCITASGDRPLHLLLEPCSEIVAIDANEMQNMLFKIKEAALSQLEFTEYLAFLGAEGYSCNRAHVFKEKLQLDPKTRTFWEAHFSLLEKGVLYQGFVERIIRSYIKPLFHFFRKKQINKLFSFKNLDDQKKFVEEEWNSFFWKALFKVSLNPSFIRKFLIRDPGLGDFANPNLKVGDYIRERIMHGFSKNLAKESLLFSLVFQGKVYPEFYPPYLKEEPCKTIKERLDRVTVKTENVIDYLENCQENSFDCFSLSDISSYMDHKSFSRMLKGILRAAKPGAKFCLRQFLTLHKIPEPLVSHFKRDKNLEKELEDEDSCFIYRFFVGDVVK